jgi:lipopolysaccharide biosynthesis glycosyltransferase
LRNLSIRLKETVHIACAADNAYVQHATVMLCSLFENNKSNQVHIHFFSADFSQINIEIVETLVQSYQQKFDFYSLDESIFKDCYISNHVSYATYYRIVIPNLVQLITPKILYLDTDVIICKDLLPLWQTDIGNCLIAAANEPSLANNARLEIPKEYEYFNAGILLINVIDWVSSEITPTLFNYIKKHQNALTFWDQDALNANLYNQRKKISPAWNQQGAFFELSKVALLEIYGKEELAEAIKKPAIVHFTGSSKPWEYLNFHPFKYLYYQYLNQTVFKEFRPQTSLGTKLKYQIIKLVGRKIYSNFFRVIGK